MKRNNLIIGALFAVGGATAGSLIGAGVGALANTAPISTTSVTGTGSVRFIPDCEDVRAINVLNKSGEIVGMAQVAVQPPYRCVFNFTIGAQR